jgi:hypothetical protein
MKKAKGWQHNLSGVIDQHRSMPFCYGETDCCLFVAACLDAMYEGAAFANDVRERLNYHNEDEANAAIAAAGGFEKIVSEFLGEPFASNYAQPGDVVLFLQDDASKAVGIVFGHRIVGAGKQGIEFVPISRGLAAWRVG